MRGEYGRQVGDDDLDRSLLLYVRGASAKQAGESVGLSESQWRRRVTALGQAWRDARRARWLRPHGTEGRYNSGCRCTDCTVAARESAYRRAAVDPSIVKPGQAGEHRDQVESWRRATQYRDSLDSARRHRQQWTGPELEIAARDDLTVAEIAAILGRTTNAVVKARMKLRHDPKTQHLAGLPEDT